MYDFPVIWLFHKTLEVAHVTFFGAELQMKILLLS